MSLDLDDETLAALGWGTDASESTTHYVSAPKASRIAPGAIDGRSRRNWRHKHKTCATTAPVQPKQGDSV